MPHDTPTAIAAKHAKEDQWNMRDSLNYTPDNAAPHYAPPYKIYIFNLLAIPWVVPKGSSGTFTIPACDPGEPYSKPMILPSVVMDSYFIESELKTHSVSGEFMAQDIIHPTIGGNWSFGQNLDDLGCFWTRNEVPTEKELAAARLKMENTGRKLLTMATTIETSGKLDDISPLMRIFASYFGEDRSWNRIYKKLADCPGCGEPVKPNIIKHHCGFVFDPDRALLATMITPEQHRSIMEQLGKMESAEAPRNNKRTK
jgi:hypothetical protein